MRSPCVGGLRLRPALLLIPRVWNRRKGTLSVPVLCSGPAQLVKALLAAHNAS